MIFYKSYISSIQSHLFLLVGFLCRLLGTEYGQSKGCVHAEMHLNLNVAMEIEILKLGFIHCSLISIVCTYSVGQ